MTMFPTSQSSAYLTQWLKIASDGNVFVSRYASSMLDGYGFHRFLCKKCADNFNVKEHLFWDNGLPQELQDWVKLHRHPSSPCSQFQYKEAVNSSWCICGFDKSVHPMSCSECGLPTKGVTRCSACTLKNWAPGKIVEFDSIDPTAYIEYLKTTGQAQIKEQIQAQIAPIIKTLPEHKGRKFRE